MRIKFQTLPTFALILSTVGFMGIFSTALAGGVGSASPITAEYFISYVHGDTGMDAPLEAIQAQQPMRSREIIEEGIHLELSGTLKRMAGDGWYLSVDQVLHQLYMAPADIIEASGIRLNEGEEVMLSGFFYSEEGDMTGIIAVCTILVDGEKFRFREDDGTPIWRGRGSGGGRGSG